MPDVITLGDADAVDVVGVGGFVVEALIVAGF